jgi:transposase-like protein
MAKGLGRDLELERQWRGLIEDQFRSGLTIAAFCEDRQVSVSSFHYWKRELKRRDGGRPTGSVRPRKSREPSDFMPVSIIATATAVIEIEVANAIVRVRRGFDEEALARVLHVLRGDQNAPGEASPC